MSLDTCTVPGARKEDRIPAGRAELGLGIHGEAGVEQVRFHDARGAMAMVAEKLSPFMAPGRKHVVLLNNLGGTTVLEMSVLAHELARSAIADRIGHMIGPAALMTALDMRGFSVSVLDASGDDLAALAAPVAPSGWPGVHPLAPVKVRGLPDGLEAARPRPSADPAAHGILTACCEALVAAEAELNALDARAGDGDTGTTLARAARALLAVRDELPLANRDALLRAIGMELGRSMGGSSGVLLAIFFAAAGDAATSGGSLSAALRAGLARMQEVGGARPGDRTMIDALQPALAALADGGTVAAAAAAARAGADTTAGMTRARVGRSAYLNANQLTGAPDPGAWAVKLVFAALAAVT
jgi:dihydroxyacetone kinase